MTFFIFIITQIIDAPANAKLKGNNKLVTRNKQRFREHD